MPKTLAKSKTTTDALKIIERLFFHRNPKMRAMLEHERANADIARKIHDLREQAGLTQRQLAKLIGTTASVICRLEDADYDGHSLGMLFRIAAALNKRVKIEFVGKQRKRAS